MEIRADGAPPQARLDRTLVRHVLANLLSNALKYSPSGEAIRLDVVLGDGSIEFRVADRGIGIPHEERDHLFESFHRGSNVGDRPGAGLGLAVAKRAATAHGGTIAAEPREGGGTVFTFRIPSARGPA